MTLRSLRPSTYVEIGPCVRVGRADLPQFTRTRACFAWQATTLAGSLIAAHHDSSRPITMCQGRLES